MWVGSVVPTVMLCSWVAYLIEVTIRLPGMVYGGVVLVATHLQGRDFPLDGMVWILCLMENVLCNKEGMVVQWCALRTASLLWHECFFLLL